MYFSLRVSVLLTLGLGVLAAGFLLRTYIVFHDCAHGSFLPSKQANIWLGSALGVLVYAPFHNWRHNHAVHHATASDLDRRGQGDVPTLTVAEYNARPFKGRLGYRLFRNPLVMFGLGPLFAMILGPRLVPKNARQRIRRSVHATNIALAVLIVGSILLVGWRDFLLIQGPAALIAGSAGIFLFYVQHQFEDTFWERNTEWTFVDAALRGSSYLRLPKVLQFFTGNIGLHHVHHLNARIPNYNLQAAHDANPMFHDVPTLSLWDAVARGAAEAVGRGRASARDVRRRARGGARRGAALRLTRRESPTRRVAGSGALRARRAAGSGRRSGAAALAVAARLRAVAADRHRAPAAAAVARVVVEGVAAGCARRTP